MTMSLILDHKIHAKMVKHRLHTPCIGSYTDGGGGGGGKTDTPTNYIQFVPNLSPDKVFCFRAKTHVFVYSTDMTASDAS